MATPEEVREKLEAMSPEEFARFNKSFGSDTMTPEDWAQAMLTNPPIENRICYFLAIPTEEEKVAKATVDAAESSRISATAARHSVITAWVGICIAVVSLIISLIAIFKN